MSAQQQENNSVMFPAINPSSNSTRNNNTEIMDNTGNRGNINNNGITNKDIITPVVPVMPPASNLIHSIPVYQRATSSIYQLLHANAGNNTSTSNNNNNTTTTTTTSTTTNNNNIQPNLQHYLHSQSVPPSHPHQLSSPTHSPVNSISNSNNTNPLPQHLIPPLNHTTSSFLQSSNGSSATTTHNNNNNNSIPNLSRSFQNQSLALNRSQSAISHLQYQENNIKNNENDNNNNIINNDAPLIVNENIDTIRKKRSLTEDNSYTTTNNKEKVNDNDTGIKKIFPSDKVEENNSPPSNYYNSDNNKNDINTVPLKKVKKSNNVPTRRNTQELIAKKIAEEHLDKPISEYATIVRKAELEVMSMDPQLISKSSMQAAEQNKERERQIFALLWLMKNCESKHDSYVPRGRIFAQYASSCAQNKLKPLSQASLGKLIRTVFPDLTTRRLGMRGQSKYHYCGLKLISDEFDDTNDMMHNANNSTTNTNEKSTNNDNKSNTNLVKIKQVTPLSSSSTSLTSNSATPAPPDHQFSINSNLNSKESNTYDTRKIDTISSYNPTISTETSLSETGPKKVDFSNDQLPITLKREPSSNMKNLLSSKSLRSPKSDIPFLENSLPRVFDNTEINSPNYKLNLPHIPTEKLLQSNSNIDTDIASSLESLYHVYCNTIFENIKFFKFDLLSKHLFLSNSGSISPQMYNLFISEELYPWIRQCDLITHMEIIKYLSNLVINHNNVTEGTFSKLEKFIEMYPEQIIKATVDLPSTVINSKLEIAKQFITLLKKLLKLLKFIMGFLKSYESFKDGMNKDWTTIINLEDIFEMVTTDKSTNVLMQCIKTHIATQTATFLNDEGPNSLHNVIISLLQFISKVNAPSCEVVDAYVRFTNALIGDISLKSSDNLLPWLFFNNITIQLLNYSSEITKFLSEE